MKFFLLLFLLLPYIYAKTLIEPVYTYVASGAVTDLFVDGSTLYCSTEDGKVDIFNINTKKKVKNIKLEKIKDFMGDEVDSKIFSIDKIGEKLLILSQDNGGYSRVHIYKDSKLILVISQDDMLNIIKAKFIDRENILLALVSNDIISYNIKNRKINWTTQASMSKFSNFALNKDKSKVAVVDESGDIHIFSTKDAKVLKTLSGENVDNIFAVDFKNDVIITGGQDRRVGIYNIKNKTHYHKLSQFFVYGVGLSPSGEIAAYSSDMDNNIELFSVNTRESLGKYKTNKMIVNGIYFINEKEFFVNSSSNKIGFYKTK